MNSEKGDDLNSQVAHQQTQPVIYSTTTVIIGILGYALILILAKLANDNRNLVFESASFGQSVDHIIEVDLAESTQTKIWEFIGTSGSAKVDSYVRKVEGSKLFAFKGVVVIDEHISDVMKTFGSVSTTPEWADMLQIMETLPVFSVTEHSPPTEQSKKGLFGGLINKFKSIAKKPTSEAAEMIDDGDNILLNRPLSITSTNSATTNTYTLSDIVYQYYTLPWPISPREFLFRRDFTVHPTTRSITSRYVSTTDDRQPLPTKYTTNTTPSGKAVSKHTIRAESPFTNWFFQDLETYCLHASVSDTIKLTPHTTTTSTGTNTDANTIADTTASHPGAHATQVCEEVLRTILTESTTSDNAPKRANRRTYIEIESLVDNKGSLPAWLVNYVQR